MDIVANVKGVKVSGDVRVTVKRADISRPQLEFGPELKLNDHPDEAGLLHLEPQTPTSGDQRRTVVTWGLPAPGWMPIGLVRLLRNSRWANRVKVKQSTFVSNPPSSPVQTREAGNDSFSSSPDIIHQGTSGKWPAIVTVPHGASLSIQG